MGLGLTCMRASAAALMVFPALCTAGEPVLPDIAQYEGVLTKYVQNDGRVDYAGIRAASALEDFTRQLAAVSPDSHAALFPSREAKLAYWINAYNALVLRSFAEEYPEKRERLKGTLGKWVFFYRMKHQVGGRSRSLANIEDHSIRNAGDPRIHFAIVCASAGCPALSRKAYRAETLQDQLEAEARKYFAEARNFAINKDRREIKLPKILEWFKDDFGKTDNRVLEFVSRYRAAEAEQIRSGSWRLAYFEYDWSPNDIRR
jgi:hypothetical protein